MTQQEIEERRKNMAKAAEMQKMRSAQGEYAYQQQEKAAFTAGAEKQGGFLGIGGHYGAQSKEAMATGGADMTGEGFSNAAGKAGAAKSLLEGVTGKSLGTMAGGGEKGGAVDGATSGALSGAAFGPYGAAVGAVAGGIMGAAKSRAAKKSKQREIEGKKLAALGQIEEDKGKAIAEGYNNMAQNILGAF